MTAPVRNRFHDLCDHLLRLGVLVAERGLHQTLGTEFFAIGVFGLGNAVRVGDEQIVCPEFDGLLFVTHRREQPHHCARDFKQRRLARAQQQRRQVTGIRIRQDARALVVGAEKECRVFLGRGACVQLPV
jgi:hypothetical protein